MKSYKSKIPACRQTHPSEDTKIDGDFHDDRLIAEVTVLLRLDAIQ